MKKMINQPGNVPMETIQGFVQAYPERYVQIPDIKGIRVKDVKDKVALVIGGGSGHEPMYAMFVGENLADASASGMIFASPDPNTIMKTAMSVERGKGVLFVYGNYSGDMLNFDMAQEFLGDMGIVCQTVRVWDDVASAPRERIEDRRGIAGAVMVIKVAGAAAGSGLDLSEVVRITQKARDHVFSIGVALSGGTIPGENKPAFTLPDTEIEFGMGVHGEPGICRMEMKTADEIVDILLEKLLNESDIRKGEEVCTLINGLGASTLAELYILNRRLSKRLSEKGILVHHMDVNSYITCQEMAGASISLMRMDKELKKYYDMPCDSPHYCRK